MPKSLARWLRQSPMSENTVLLPMYRSVRPRVSRAGVLERSSAKPRASAILRLWRILNIV